MPVPRLPDICLRSALTGLAAAALAAAPAAAKDPAAAFAADIRPILTEHCFDCHADGAKKGGVAFDEHGGDAPLLADRDLWFRVLKNVRGGLMPPPDKKQPAPEQRAALLQWIKSDVFQLDPARPDPGRPVLRRLNRTEYRNTIRDLTGVDFRVDEEFPADDSGHGFDNIGEVLTVSPMMLEKYLAAAKSIIQRAVPAAPRSMPENKADGYDKWFPREVPADAEARAAYAGELLRGFASRAFRRPADDDTVARLTKIAAAVWQQPQQSFESGIARAMEAVLASPRFLFMEEVTEAPPADGAWPLIDEYSLAARLSYFLWSTTPDAELLRLASENKLRAELIPQFNRMLADEKSKAFFRSFPGQWLQSRDIEGIPIDARSVLLREQKPDPEFDNGRKRFFELRRREATELTAEERAEMEKLREIFRKSRERFQNEEFTGEMRRDMRRETELFFEHIIRQDRPLTELIDSDYTFLNRRLAAHYGVPGVDGDEFRRVQLPADSARGGILTQGTVLAVTSNPTRTSPVKRGLFILDNILGTPPPPPPPNVPALEDFSKGRGFEGTLRENLARHRADAKCASCHNRMDPLGLAFENFNAMGKWREIERGQSIDAGGKLVSGEEFKGARELKKILTTGHREAFFRCLTEKLLIYALGRGLTYSDETTIDRLVDQLQQSGGSSLTLLRGIVQSDAFLRRRTR